MQGTPVFKHDLDMPSSVRAAESAERAVPRRQHSSSRRCRQAAEGGRASGAGDAGEELQTPERRSGEGAERGQETYVRSVLNTQTLSFFHLFQSNEKEKTK